MSEPSSGHRVLQVIRVTDVKNARKARLRVEIKLDDSETVHKTGEIDNDGKPGWSDTFTFMQSNASTSLSISLKKSRKFLRPLGDGLLGRTSIAVARLLQESADHAVELTLLSSSRVGEPEHTGTIFLSCKEIDALSRADIDVSAAEQSVERIKLSIEKPESAIAVIGSVIEVVDVIIEVVDKVAEIHPVFNVSWKAASALYKLVSYQYESDRKLVETVEKMKIAYEISTVAGTLNDRTKMLKPLVKELLNVTIDCSRFVQEYARHSFVGRTPRVLSKGRIDEFADRFVALRKDMDSVIGLTTAKRVDEIRQQQLMDAPLISETHNAVADIGLVQRLEVLEKQLNPFKSDASNVSKRPRCLEGTRREYLDPIMGFISSDSTPNVLWLTGAAGSGKSTIAVTASDECDKMGWHAAYLFFEREKGDPSSVIRTVAYQLSELHPSIASRVSEAVGKHKNINRNTLKTQFEVLLLGPLNAAADEVEGRIGIILDALDESGTAEQREELLNLLEIDFARLPSKVRVLVTSRPENDIMKGLLSKSHIHHIALEHRSDRSQHDVNRYIRETMSGLVGEAAANEEGWNDKMQILCDAADGLFIWASTAIKMVKRSDVMEEQLDGLLEDIRTIGGYGIDGLYATALKDCGIMWRSTKSKDRFARVVGLVVLAKEELTAHAIANMLGIREDLVNITLGCLQPVLSFGSGGPVHLHHASFADYLLSNERSGEQRWHIDEDAQRVHIAERCFDIMTEGLRFNICNIESSFVYNKDIMDLHGRIQENIPLHLDYSCRFWATHVCELSQSMDLSGLERLNGFARSHLLHWLEVLSLTGNFNRVAARALYEVSLWAAPIDKEMSSFMWAAYRLASVFSYPMSQSAPQIYLSALSLWTGESRVADHYSRMYPSVPVHRYGSKPPAQCIKVIQGHRNRVESVAFSTDGKRVVSGSCDMTIRVWDADTGELVLGPLVGHSHYVTSIAFSPDSKRVVSGSFDETIRIWCAVSGELVCGPIKGHKDNVNSVAFSPDGNRVVSGSRDNTICVWDANTGELISGPFEGHTGAVKSVSFSSDGKRVVSGSADKTIRVWDADSSKLISGPFEGHTDEVNSVAFSPDGKRVISGSRDKAVRVWNVESRELIKSFEGHTSMVTSVAFSVDGKLAASGSYDRTVRIWDSGTGELVAGPFEGHTDWVTSVAFSPDEKRVVSGSDDRTIRIWDADSGTILSGESKVDESRVRSVGVSVYGKRAVFGFENGKIHVWNTDTGELASDAFDGNTSIVTSIALSPEGGFIASGSGDGTIRVWKASSGELVTGPLGRHTDSVSSLAFSPDGNRVVSGSMDTTVCIWSAKSGQLVLGPLKEHTHRVESVAFSPDGKLVVSGSYDMTIRIWDSISGELVSRPFQGHGHLVTSVAFSPDGEKVVSGSGAGTIQIWNVGTGEVVSNPFEGRISWVLSVAFSRDGKRVVSGSIDKTIRVWNAVSCELISTIYGHIDGVLSVAFSLDGRHIYSGSADGTIRKRVVGGGEVAHESISQDSDGSLSAAHAALGRTSIADRGAEGPCLDLSRRFLDSNWKMEDDGWVVSDRGELLTWVPEDMRMTLWEGRRVSVFGPGCQFSTRLDFSNAPVGEGWSKSFPRQEQRIA